MTLSLTALEPRETPSTTLPAPFPSGPTEPAPPAAVRPQAEPADPPDPPLKQIQRCELPLMDVLP